VGRIGRVRSWWVDALKGIPRWVMAIGWPYLAFMAALLAVSAAASLTERRWLVGVSFVALLVAASWLSDAIRSCRRSPLGRETTPARIVLALLVLAAGIVLVALAGGSFGYLLGLSLVVTGAAALISEARWSSRSRLPWGLALLAAAVTGLMLAAALGTWDGPGGRMVLFIVAGIALGEIGAELLSEHTNDASFGLERRTIGVFLGAGAGLLGLATVGFLGLGNMEPFHFVLLLVALGIVVIMASSDSDSLLLVVVLAAALIWASAPRGATLPASRIPQDGKDYFLVLGDSWISGEGAEVYLEGTNTTRVDADHTNECRRAPTAWPVGLAGAGTADLPRRLLFAACSGAVTENISTEPRLNARGRQRGPAELAVFEREREELGDPAFVLVSVGGNDAGFSKIGTACVGPGSCAAIAGQMVDDGEPGPSPEVPGEPDGAEDLASIGDDLDEAYENILAVLHNPDIPVIAVPYPVPLSATGDCDDLLLDKAERTLLVHFTAALNAVIEAKAHEHGLLYMDTMETALESYGTRLCDGDGARAGLNFLAFNPKAGSERDNLNPTNWTHNSFHPNAEGHEAMLNAAIDWFRDNPALTLDAETESDPPPLTLAGIYGGDPVPAQCEPADEQECEFDRHHWLEAQATRLYTRTLVPLGLATIGLWLLLTPLRRWGRDRDLGLASVVRAVIRRPPANP
jgi:lysophospholipase L1-like esterase